MDNKADSVNLINNNTIYEGAVFMEDMPILRSFNDLINMASQLKDVGIKTLEMFGLWKHCNSSKPGSRWATRDFSVLDPARGTETDFTNFVNVYHSLGMHILPLVVMTISVLPSSICSGKTCQPLRYDLEGIGGALYRYKLQNPKKKIFIKNTSGNPECDFLGYGWVADLSSPDVINFFTEFYNKQITGRNLDGMRMDTPATHSCKAGDNLYFCTSTCRCPDPTDTVQDPLPFYRIMRRVMLPNHVFISESYTTHRHTDTNWFCSYPYYPPDTNLDEVAEVSEGYEFEKILSDILNNRLNSTQFVYWINNQPITFNRSRFRMIRNCNGDVSTLRFVATSPAYFPSVTLACTSPGVPKCTDYELFGSSVVDKEYNITRTNTPDACKAHWKQILKIRNNSKCLKDPHSTIRNVWKSGNEIIAYLRTNGIENYIITINFSNIGRVSTLNLTSLNLNAGTYLIDQLSGQTFTIKDPSNFNISISAYGSRILSKDSRIR